MIKVGEIVKLIGTKINLFFPRNLILDNANHHLKSVERHEFFL